MKRFTLSSISTALHSVRIPLLILSAAWFAVVTWGFVPPALHGDSPAASAAARGQSALLGESHIGAMWSRAAYENAWRLWGVQEKPADYARAFLQRYGLHAAPYENDGLPMGLRRAPGIREPGIAIDCMLCHGGSIAGKSSVGLPNTTLDLTLLFSELSLAENREPFRWPFELNRTRGTSNAGAVAAFVLGFRNPDLSPRVLPQYLGWKQLPDLDPPAWWHWKRKKTIYQDGGTDARSVRSTMQFIIGGNSPEKIKTLEPAWEDVKAYVFTLQPPKYPLPITQDLASAGEELFSNHCARCHGTYGPEGSYPNKIIPIAEIGSDRARYDGISQEFRDYYDKSWLGEKYPTLPTNGYQAPPLDGIWATAPYLHNGSVPTVGGVLQSSERPRRFQRLPTTNLEAYDHERLGWKVELVDSAPPRDLPDIELRKIYDTTQFGKGNGGHTFGDHLSDHQRRAVIEYLKTL